MSKLVEVDELGKITYKSLVNSIKNVDIYHLRLRFAEILVRCGAVGQQDFYQFQIRISTNLIGIIRLRKLSIFIF